MNLHVSPKAVAAAAAPLVFALVCFLITGNENFLLIALGAPAAGIGAFTAPPAAKVNQDDVARLSRRRKHGT